MPARLLASQRRFGPLPLRGLAVLRGQGASAGWRSLDMARMSRYCGGWRALEAAGQVRFAGTLAQDAGACLLQVSDIFAIMSTSETQSMALLRPMASGVAVVPAGARDLPGFVGPSIGVLVDPHDPVRLARTPADRLASPERWRFGSGGRWSVEKYGVEAVTDAWVMRYRSVPNGRSAA